MTDLEKNFLEVRRATAERLQRMTPQERDQVLQMHLAAAMSPQARFRTLASMTALMLAMRKGASNQGEGQDDGRSAV